MKAFKNADEAWLFHATPSRTRARCRKSDDLAADDWRRQLHQGDEVTWNDPDDGLCSRTGTISRIEYLPDDCARITMTDGWQAEVMLRELE